MRITETRRRMPGQRVPPTAGPDEVTVQLRRKDFRRAQRRARRTAQRRAQEGARTTGSRRGLRGRWRSILGLVVVLALLGTAVWGLYFSPYLTAQEVEVVGAREVGDVRVERAVELPAGTPLARLDLDGIRDRVEAIPAVRRAEVSRSWPETLRVQVVPREPVAVVAGGSGLQALDAEGARFGAYASAPRDLPEVRPAGDLEGEEATEAVTEAAAVLASLPAGVTDRVRAVEVGSVDEIVLLLGNERRVVWGSSEQSQTKAEVLALLLEDLPEGVQQVDVSVPGRPTTS